MSDADRTRALQRRLAAAASDALGEPDAAEPADRPARRSPRVVEVGIGERPAVAAGLARRGFAVTATDVVDRTVPDTVSFVRDDLTEPDSSVYRDAVLVYARRLPPELHRSLASVAADAGARAAFTTLGGDPPAVPVEPEQLAGGATLYWIEPG